MADDLILITEDNEKNRRLLRDLLGYQGYRIIEAETGAEGVEMALEHRPALILMDIQLPDIDGIEAFRRLQADPTTRGIPVVAVTASAMREERARIEETGLALYLPKPIDLDGLLVAVEQILAANDGRQGTT